jgi:hypothetical protein
MQKRARKWVILGLVFIVIPTVLSFLIFSTYGLLTGFGIIHQSSNVHEAVVQEFRLIYPVSIFVAVAKTCGYAFLAYGTLVYVFSLFQKKPQV